ncbi:MAG: UbiA family prenyltransferase [Methanobacterium sp.]|nr:UbiA family prenyltransferase [Methanobacterium sp.]
MIKTMEGLFRAARMFPYLNNLIMVFPFYMILFVNGYINSAYSLLLVLPFIGAITAGFMYNTICDAPFDPKSKNPITRGDITEKTTRKGIILSIIVSLLLFVLFYKSYQAFILFSLYIFLWFAYSGFKIRFKETFLGPFIASFMGFLIPFILLVNFNFFNYPSILLLISYFLIYLAHEIKHTVVDYDEDKVNNIKTFAVIVGRGFSSIIEYLLLIISTVLLLVSSYSIGNAEIFNIIFAFLFLFSIISSVVYGFKNKFAVKEYIFNALPYMLIKIFIIVYAGLVFGLPGLLILFLIWLSLLDKYGTW